VARSDLEALLKLLNLPKKREVERYARELVITSEALTDLLFTGRIGGLGIYSYTCHHDEIRPDHLEPTQSELNALGSNGVGLLRGEARKFSSKIGQFFKERRLFSAHLFYSSSQKYWHLFYMDQRDYTNRSNHWKHGPHIHYTNECFTHKPLEDVWRKITHSPPELPPSIHIRYDYHHHRPKHRLSGQVDR
jgi:hypothetical protein